MSEQALATPADATALAAAWKEFTGLVLKAAADHAVQCGDTGLEGFHGALREAASTLQAEPSPSQVLIQAGAVSQAFGHYGAQTQRRVDALTRGMAELLALLLDHIEHLQDDAASGALLDAIREATTRQALAAGLETAREKLEETLPQLRQNAQSTRAAARELANRLQDRITVLEQDSPARSAAAPLVSGGAVDACTGLPARAEAETAIQRLTSEDGEAQGYIGVFYLHRMALTNARFGEAIGNQVILFCSQHIATTVLRGTDSLFRWTGPAFVAILDRPEAHLTVRAEVQRLISSPLSRFFETPSRSVYLPIKLTCEVLAAANHGYAEIADSIEQFILKASGQVTAE